MDLIVATVSMLLAGVVLAWVNSRWLVDRPKSADAVLCIAILAATACVYFSRGWLTWARYVPLTAAIVWTNLAPLFLCLAAGAVLASEQRPRWRRLALASLIGMFVLGTLLQPIAQPVISPVSSSPTTIWLPGGVCQQSSQVTCSPAAAATLLKTADVAAEERDLIRWCLTDKLGTTSLGLWRGLAIACTDSTVRPEVMNVTLADLLSRQHRDDVFPCLLLVGFPRFGLVGDAETERRYTEQYGWPRGFRHSVVLFGPHEDGGLDIGDPSIGRERWAEEDLHILWRGEAVKLTPR